MSERSSEQQLWTVYNETLRLAEEDFKQAMFIAYQVLKANQSTASASCVKSCLEAWDAYNNARTLAYEALSKARAELNRR